MKTYYATIVVELEAETLDEAYGKAHAVTEKIENVASKTVDCVEESGD
jgi:hypothetical protein